ncbi:hypothetical protein OOK13_28775 [Streptomyces sp. NBC_00378]|uniref:hypothetical protein n=1 Tax=unclassified Streptomyces TaxID=2593676 RepID=UPI002258EE2A|nr:MULTISPECIES: hypothetical protein [unclassified Streptomyces]MCX5112415.1 hypothetical protein [Streptomyces sp. NBC_00378]
MPTYEATPRFTADLHRLTPDQRQRFRRIVKRAFVPDLRSGHRTPISRRGSANAR